MKAAFWADPGKLCQPGAGCMSRVQERAKHIPLPCSMPARCSRVRDTAVKRTCVTRLHRGSCFTVGLHLSAFPPSVRTGSFPI